MTARQRRHHPANQAALTICLGSPWGSGIIRRVNLLREKFQASPIYARLAPFFIFCALTTAGGMLGGDWKYWFYALKVFVGAWIVWEMRPFVTEMRWA